LSVKLLAKEFKDGDKIVIDLNENKDEIIFKKN